MPVYMVTYGLWRFVAEYLRADDRGATVVDFLSPSQLISTLLIAGGLVLLAVEIYVDRNKAAASTDAVEMPVQDGGETVALEVVGQTQADETSEV